MLTRRSYLTTAMALASCAHAAEPAESDGEIYPRDGHPGRRITIRGKRLYVDVTGPARAPALVFIHGGPGGGAYPFDRLYRQRFGSDIRLVVFDQRGCLRSEAVGESEPFVLDDLVEDTEALRRELGIQRWSLLAHSFGGLIATRYAVRYPDNVDKLLFDNPSFDIASSDRAMMELLAIGYERLGRPERAAEVRAAALAPMTARETWQAFSRAGAELGLQQRLDLYAHSLPPGYIFQWLREAGLPEANWLRGSGPSQATLWQDDACFESLFPRLRELRAPALLIKGRYDYNTSPEHLEAFRTVSTGRIVEFENSAHLTFAEEPERYAQVVRDFVLSA